MRSIPVNHTRSIIIRACLVGRYFRSFTGCNMARHLSRLMAVMVKVLAVTATPVKGNDSKIKHSKETKIEIFNIKTSTLSLSTCKWMFVHLTLSNHYGNVSVFGR